MIGSNDGDLLKPHYASLFVLQPTGTVLIASILYFLSTPLVVG